MGHVSTSFNVRIFIMPFFRMRNFDCLVDRRLRVKKEYCTGKIKDHRVLSQPKATAVSKENKQALDEFNNGTNSPST